MYILISIFVEVFDVSLILTSSFAERLKEALEFTTTTEFAEAVGVSKQTISAYTTGVRKPKAPTIKVMADILNVNAAWLLGYVTIRPLASEILYDSMAVQQSILRVVDALGPRFARPGRP